MVNISNADRDKAVELLRAYAALLQQHGCRSTKDFNARRVASILAKKLERKEKTNALNKSTHPKK